MRNPATPERQASATALAHAPPAAVWRVVCAIGGDNGYHALNALWRLRGALDRLVGGPGLRLGRQHPTLLRLGERFDCWTVVALAPERRLALRLGMRAPGVGLLAFDLQPLPAAVTHASPQTRLTVTASWRPHGAWGLAYWYAMAPAHGLLFPRMAAAMARRAETLADAAQACPRP
jgi:hypothetical protein